ncbi:MAG: HAMP domain-containing sensor histidine kinase [Candidatus Binatia bacterium]
MGNLLLRRLGVTVALYLVLVGNAVALEVVLRPERRRAVALSYLGHLVCCGTAMLASRVPRIRARPEILAAALFVTLSLVLSAYTTLGAGNPERLASAQFCLLSALFVLLPWRWPAQLAVSLAGLGGIVAAGAYLGVSEPLAWAFVVLLTGTATSVLGVRYLDRFRYQGFVREALLARASEEKREEAEITATLLHVADTLSQHLSEVDLLTRLTRVAVEALGCDWGTTFVLDESRGVWRLDGVFGGTPWVEDEMRAVEFTAANLPLISVLRPGRLVEIPDAAAQDLIPPMLLARWEVASQIVAPIVRRDHVAGAFCLAYRARRTPFSERERRIALGIAHATAVALENVRLIADLRTANALRSEFVSTMSHELRTPLNVILGFAEMGRDLAPPAEVATCLERIDTAGRDLMRLIEDTLEVGRIEAGRDAVQLETVRLAALWQALGRECLAMTAKPTVALEWAGDVPDVTLVTDPRRLGIVVRNLVHNALKFTEEGWVRATARVDGAQLVVSVVDTGIGVRPEDHGVIFEMFRQADGSDSRRYGGTGLGLHIVRRFVGQLGGRVTLDSALGRGSTFTVHLPREADAASASRAA